MGSWENSPDFLIIINYFFLFFFFGGAQLMHSPQPLFAMEECGRSAAPT